MLKQKIVKGTNLCLSPIVLGTDYFGTTRPKELAFQIMDAYMERGGNVFDTARVYGAGFPGGDGASESTVGAYIKERSIRRKVIISSKAGHPPLGNMHQGRLSYREIEDDIDTGLSKLQTDYIDILWLHRDDPSRPVEDIIDTLDDMVRKGKILCYGASNWMPDRLDQANRYAHASDKQPFVASQIQWSLAICHNIEDDTLVQMDGQQEGYYRRHNMPVFAYSAQAKGFFEKYDKQGLAGKAEARYLTDDNIASYRKLKELSQQTGHSLSVLSLAYLLATDEFDAFPIIGASKPEQVADSMQVMELDSLPKELLVWRNGQ